LEALTPLPQHILDLLDAAAQSPSLASAIANGFEHPPSYFPWWADEDACERLRGHFVHDRPRNGESFEKLGKARMDASPPTNLTIACSTPYHHGDAQPRLATMAETFAVGIALSYLKPRWRIVRFAKEETVRKFSI
jgi:hypothetical protein